MGNKALIIIDVQYGQIEGQPRAGRADAVLANLNRASRWRAANTCR